MTKTCRVLVPLPPVRALATHVYDYTVPDDMNVAAGDYVAVNFARQQVVGVVWDAPPDESVPAHKLKPIGMKLAIARMSPALQRFIDRLARYTMTPHGAVLRMVLAGTGALQMPLKKRAREQEDKRTSDALVPQLTEAQGAAAAELVAKVSAGFSVTLLDGVTGSGKTEVYSAAIERALAAGHQALVMLPEIALSAQLLQRLAVRFGFAPVEWHSLLTPAQRRRHWHAIASGEAKLVVGARSALMLPYAALGIVVVDEEHEHSFKQEEGVTYQARDMAVVRAQEEKIPIILSTATPSLETWGNVQAGRYGRVALPARFNNAAMPVVKLVNTLVEKPARQSWLSPPLIAALREQMERGEQSLLYLNRRGYAPLTLCRTCGHRFQCPQCATWLVRHDNAKRLQCHHCGYGQTMPDVCSTCGSAELAACGPGVERVGAEVAALFPDARRAVLTSDTPADPKEVRALIDSMAAGDVDILIGTQMVTKGHNFPNLTLVGVVDADLGLAGGDLRAAERTYQVLTQVAGRAGRTGKPSRVIVQTTAPDAPLMQALAHGNRDEFLREQLAERELFGMPPFGRLAALIISGVDLGAVERAGKVLAAAAPHPSSPDGYDVASGVVVLGPAPAPIARLRGKHRTRFLLKAPRTANVQALLHTWLSRAEVPASVKVQVDVDPYGFM